MTVNIIFDTLSNSSECLMCKSINFYIDHDIERLFNTWIGKMNTVYFDIYDAILNTFYDDHIWHRTTFLTPFQTFPNVQCLNHLKENQSFSTKNVLLPPTLDSLWKQYEIIQRKGCGQEFYSNYSYFTQLPHSFT